MGFQNCSGFDVEKTFLEAEKSSSVNYGESQIIGGITVDSNDDEIAMPQYCEALESRIGSLCIEVAPVYRFFSGTDHFYTLTADESCANRDNCGNELLAGYGYEGIGFYLPQNIRTQNQSLFVKLVRLFDPQTGDHLYTMDSIEVASAKSIGYQEEEGNLFVSPSAREGFVPLHRWYRASSNDHFYTTWAGSDCVGKQSSSTECGGETVNENDYIYEGIAAFVIPR